MWVCERAMVAAHHACLACPSTQHAPPLPAGPPLQMAEMVGVVQGMLAREFLVASAHQGMGSLLTRLVEGVGRTPSEWAYM